MLNEKQEQEAQQLSQLIITRMIAEESMRDFFGDIDDEEKTDIYNRAIELLKEQKGHLVESSEAIH